MGLPRIPQYYKRQGYQRFFAGLIIGFIGGWVFFLLNFGELQDGYITKIKKQKEQIASLEKDKEILQEDQEKLNEENQNKLTIQEVKVFFTNKEKSKIGSFTLYQLEEAVKDELQDIINKDIQTVANSWEITKKMLENKRFKIEKETYRVTIQHSNLYTKLEVYLKVQRTRS